MPLGREWPALRSVMFVISFYFHVNHETQPNHWRTEKIQETSNLTVSKMSQRTQKNYSMTLSTHTH